MDRLEAFRALPRKQRTLDLLRSLWSCEFWMHLLGHLARLVLLICAGFWLRFIDASPVLFSFVPGPVYLIGCLGLFRLWLRAIERIAQDRLATD